MEGNDFVKRVQLTFNRKKKIRKSRHGRGKPISKSQEKREEVKKAETGINK